MNALLGFWKLFSGLVVFVLAFSTFSASAEPATPAAPTVTAGYQQYSMNVSWNSVPRAVKYNVIQFKNDSWAASKQVTSTAAVFIGTEGNRYKYMVNACDSRGECSMNSAWSAEFSTMVRVSRPEFSVAEGTYNNAVSVALSSTPGATIRYTTNNHSVTESSPIYSGPITLTQTTTLRVKAYKSGMIESFDNAATYTIVYVVQASASTGGSISPSSRTVNRGATSSFTVTPITGYRVSSVTGCSGSLSGSTYTTGAITSACTVSASFTKKTYTVSASAGAGGSMSPASKVVSHGSSTSFTVTSNSGYEVTSVSGCSGSLSGATYTTGAITSACTVSASFNQKTYTVSASAGVGGSLSPGSKVVNHGSTISFTLTPDPDYQIESVSGCSGSLSGTTYTTGAITASCTVSANFVRQNSTVTASASTGGSITPTNAVVAYNAPITFIVTPAAGYAIDGVSGCGGQLNGQEFHVANVVGACHVDARFKLISPMEPEWAKTGTALVPEPTVSSPNYSRNSFNEIGALEAQANVVGGQSSYTIPIKIAPGRAGMQPSVGLSYNSSNGNGIAGMGWSLHGAAAITRCGSSYAVDGITKAVTLTSSDKLCYNGSRLVVTHGAYGVSGAEYALEIDNLSRIVQTGGNMASSNASFVLYEPSGRVSQFGVSSNSRIIPEGQPVIQSWLLERVADATGENTMRYVYQHLGQAEVLLSQIIYTGTATSDGLGKVEFVYEGREDKSLRYVGGGRVQQTQRLARIVTSYANSKIREYHLGYGDVSVGSGRTLLRDVQECGYADGMAACLLPTTFNWSEQHAGYALERVPYSGYSAYRTITHALPRGDTNGDGSRDWNGHFIDAEGDVQLSHNFELPGCSFDAHRQTYVCVQADFNLDGRTDGVDQTGSQLRLALTVGEGSSLSSSWITTSISLNASSSWPLGRDRVEGFADFNGDGWPDMLMYRVNGASPDYRVYLHSQNPTMPYTGSGVVVYVPKLEYTNGAYYATTSVQLMGDMNADGLADLVVMNNNNRAYSYPQPMPVSVLYNNWNGVSLTFNGIQLPFAPTMPQWGYFSYFIDVNGDGLTDWVGWHASSGLQYSINTGVAFSPLQQASGDTTWLQSRSYHAINGVNTSEEQTMYYPKYSGAFRVMDTNNNGKAELLVPAERLIESCIMYSDIVGSSPAYKEFCGDEMYGAVRTSSTSDATIPIPAESRDESIYRYHAVHFSLSDTGQLSVELVPTELIGSATQSAAVDAYGNGLDNLMFTYGTRFTSGQRFNGTTSPLGTQYGTWINRNLGDGINGQTRMDALVSVTDAMARTAQWDYLPLSSGEATVAGAPLYATSHDYVADNHHFHFASSMHVVSNFTQSNGVGTANAKRYAYRGAVYNHAGRGFSGFRSVIVEDMALGVIEHADYLQKVPFTGRLQGQFTFRSNEYPSGQFNVVQGWSPAITYGASGQHAFAVMGADFALTQATQRWALHTTHKAQTGHCSSATDNATGHEQWQCGGGQHRYLVYPLHHTSITRDLHTKAHVSVRQRVHSNVDEYGNILVQTQSTEDDYGVYSTTVTQVFEGSAAWPHKLTSRTVTNHAVQQRHVDDPYNGSASNDSDSWVKTTFSNYHSSRQPRQISVTTSDNSHSKTLTKTFNSYGLPLTLSESAEVMDSAGNWHPATRTTTLVYGDTSARAHGAFVYQITNPAAHTQTINTSPATGLVISSTDANNLTTQLSYDAFGRLTKQQSPGVGDVSLTLDSVAYDSNAPAFAAWMQVKEQQGMPEQRTYFDKLGRTLRTAVQGFNGDWVNTDAQYDALGRLIAESLPYKQGSSIAWTSYSHFDAFNRPGRKLTHHGRLSINYAYNGLVTHIDANGLSMTRTYNSLDQLMKTVDANGGVTTYSYNGQGLPLVLRDANGVSLYAGYNALGQKLFVSDPNQGDSQFQYNGFGELEQETDANGVVTRHDYDSLGRAIAVNATQGGQVVSQSRYYFDGVKKGLPHQESANGVVRSFDYDAFSRLTTNTMTIDGQQFQQHYQYHSQSGQLLARTYPNDVQVAYEYNSYGYLERELNATSGYVYRQYLAHDAFGNITQVELGNGVIENSYYDSSTGWLQAIESYAGSLTIHELNYSNYDDFGNLLSYSNAATGVSDDYQYDALHRLEQQTTRIAGFSTAINLNYDAVGNLLSKSDYGTQYVYGNRSKTAGGNAGANAVRQVTKIDGSSVNFSYDQDGNLTSGDGLTISYTSFKQPSAITRGGNQYSFTYGAQRERVKVIRDGVTTYEVDHAYEESPDGSWKVYLGTMAIISYSSSDGHHIRYRHKDRLGTSLTFSDEDGQVVGRRHYDAFGKPRMIDGTLMEPGARPRLKNFTDYAGVNNIGITRRGFTDHLHLDDVELIHMNGRVYDYNLGRFLSVDPVIQFVGNSQGINPYSYIMNNPMAGTDPTGYVIDTIWDVGNVIFDVGKVAYGAITGDSDMVSEGLTDLAVDAAATMVPFVPAGASKVARAGADKVADARQASKKTDTTPTTQRSESSSSTDGGTKTTNGADNTQSANSANQKTTDIGSQESISSTKELRGGDFNQGKAEAQQRSGGSCEYCGAGNAKEGDHFIPLNKGKKQVNAGQITKAEAKQTLNKSENIVNSCTSCNRGAGGKGTKMPSSTPGKDKWVPPNPSDHVKDKLDKL